MTVSIHDMMGKSSGVNVWENFSFLIIREPFPFSLALNSIMKEHSAKSYSSNIETMRQQG